MGNYVSAALGNCVSDDSRCPVRKNSCKAANAACLG
jgi:hypothetical protein